jgi:hypothetical protein
MQLKAGSCVPDASVQGLDVIVLKLACEPRVSMMSPRILVLVSTVLRVLISVIGPSMVRFGNRSVFAAVAVKAPVRERPEIVRRSVRLASTSPTQVPETVIVWPGDEPMEMI